MNYKQLMINKILQYNTNYTKEHLYTLGMRDLVYIKTGCLVKDNAEIKQEKIMVILTIQSIN